MRRRHLECALSFLLVAGVAGGQQTRAPAPDLILVTIDTLRADAVGRPGVTPWLDRLAASGRRFSDAHAHNVVTLPSHCNILSGLYPFQHGVRDNVGFRFPGSLDTLATVLAKAGWATAAVVGAFPLDSRYGLDRGFELYDDQLPEGRRSTEFVLPERPGSEVVDRGLTWWTSHRGRRRFLWLHLFDPHAPYGAPEPFASRFADRPYLSGVAAADAALGELLAPFLTGKEPPTVIAVTADHGESLGEHGELTHGLFAYEATLHVPLLLWGPGFAAGVDQRPARHVDLFPTLLEAVGVQPPEGGPERPGRSLLRPWDEPPTTYFESLSAAFNRGWAPLRGLVDDHRKVIQLPLPELYDLSRDPGELHNLVDDERPLARALLAALPSDAAAARPPSTPSSEESSRLGALGYVSGGAPLRQHYVPEDDPKRLIDLDARIHQLIDLYSRRELDAALALARHLVAERPSMPVGRSLLAQTLLERGDETEALAVMRQARRDDVTTETLLRQLGLTLSARGEADEALAVLAPLAATGDPQSRVAWGLALSEAGRNDDARRVAELLLGETPDLAAAWELRSLVALRQGELSLARDSAQRAVELDPSRSHAWNQLGVAQLSLGQTESALDAWERAVGLDPGLLDALYNLGLQGARNGREEVARRALAAFLEQAPAARADDLRRARVLLARLERGRS